MPGHQPNGHGPMVQGPTVVQHLQTLNEETWLRIGKLLIIIRVSNPL